jgi:catechol 2,3-dioxygenase-like lactoylglutathione lyase family enzyme
MIDDTRVIVSALDKSKRFYTEALGPIGYKLIHEFPALVTGTSMVWNSPEFHPFKWFTSFQTF